MGLEVVLGGDEERSDLVEILRHALPREEQSATGVLEDVPPVVGEVRELWLEVLPDSTQVLRQRRVLRFELVDELVDFGRYLGDQLTDRRLDGIDDDVRVLVDRPGPQEERLELLEAGQKWAREDHTRGDLNRGIVQQLKSEIDRLRQTLLGLGAGGGWRGCRRGRRAGDRRRWRGHLLRQLGALQRGGRGHRRRFHGPSGGDGGRRLPGLPFRSHRVAGREMARGPARALLQHVGDLVSQECLTWLAVRLEPPRSEMDLFAQRVRGQSTTFCRLPGRRVVMNRNPAQIRAEAALQVEPHIRLERPRVWSGLLERPRSGARALARRTRWMMGARLHVNLEAASSAFITQPSRTRHRYHDGPGRDGLVTLR